MDSMVEQMRSSCDDGSDSLACMKYKVATFLDTIFKKDNYQLFNDVEVRQNGFTGDDNSARSADEGIAGTIEQYIASHDVIFNVPVADAKITVSPRNINEDELSLKIKFADGAPKGRSAVEGATKTKH